MNTCAICGVSIETGSVCPACEQELLEGLLADDVRSYEDERNWIEDPMDQGLDVRAKFWGINDQFEPCETDAILLHDDRGRSIYITHGNEDGFLMVPPTEPVDYVVCCHPKQCQARYPHLNIVGDWDCSTGTSVAGGVLRVYKLAPIDFSFLKRDA